MTVSSVGCAVCPRPVRNRAGQTVRRGWVPATLRKMEHRRGTRVAGTSALPIKWWARARSTSCSCQVPSRTSSWRGRCRRSRVLRAARKLARLVIFDKRGTGMSDRVDGATTLEARMDDVRAVMDAAGSTRAAIVGASEGVPMSVLFAATYPERTGALVLYGGFARTLWAPDYPWGTRRRRICSRSRTSAHKPASRGTGKTRPLGIAECPRGRDRGSGNVFPLRILSRRRGGAVANEHGHRCARRAARRQRADTRAALRGGSVV